MKKILTIAGSDCSGGAGIQADIKTIVAHKMYAMSAITALTAQNTTGVYDVINVPREFLSKEIHCIMKDIFPDAIKIGMVSSKEIIEEIVERLLEYKAKNIVVDPVMISTSGSRLLSEDAMEALIIKLLPIADVITPNIPEAECICGFKIFSKENMIEAAKKISREYKGKIIIKGGHLEGCADDLLYKDGEITWYYEEKIDNSNTHGTGCTLSSAIACNLAAGYSINESISRGKKYITGALRANLNLGKGNGPLNHCWSL
ncbi:bifunctional hydroxymethylpyrimidine kinase/phosphomethylpyrimidine kinase [Clostridium subterminale]|uniref:Hydroxymethylpyrimidine/phosphomethylpyrimidine kinase n=1 Tax=Clostridium subterminale TaxID=1550 RepID=A0ABP3VZ92_CLOSU